MTKFNHGDIVRFASGKTEYEVVTSNNGDTTTIVSSNTGKGQTVHEDRLRLVKARSITFEEAVSPEFNGAVDEVEVPETDHRRSNYGIAILLALQTKLRPIGVKTRRGQGRKARRG